MVMENIRIFQMVSVEQVVVIFISSEMHDLSSPQEVVGQ